MRALICVNIIEKVAHAHAQNAPLVHTWTSSRAEAVERGLLVAYPVINIRDCALHDHLMNIRSMAFSLHIQSMTCKGEPIWREREPIVRDSEKKCWKERHYYEKGSKMLTMICQIDIHESRYVHR